MDRVMETETDGFRIDIPSHSKGQREVGPLRSASTDGQRAESAKCRAEAPAASRLPTDIDRTHNGNTDLKSSATAVHKKLLILVDWVRIERSQSRGDVR
jgi:hypothetical protein